MNIAIIYNVNKTFLGELLNGPIDPQEDIAAIFHNTVIFSFSFPISHLSSLSY